MALVEAGRLSDAALELDEAVRLDPQQLEYLVFQASVLVRLKQRTHAEDVLAAIEKQGPAKVKASSLWTLSDAYYRLERFNDALRILDLLAERNPDDPRVDLNRGQVYALRNQLDQAQAALRKSISKHPDNPLAHFELGKLLSSARRTAGGKNRVARSRPARTERSAVPSETRRRVSGFARD